MSFLKRSSAIHKSAIANGFPELLKSQADRIMVADQNPDTRSLLEPPCDFNPEAPPDLVILNAHLFGATENEPVDIAITGNIITRISNGDDVRNLASDKTEFVDAKGNSVIPGMTDSHIHLAVGMERLDAGDVEDVKTAEQFKQRLQAYAKANRRKDVLYVFGLHYCEDPIIPAAECRRFLDEIVPDKPLLVFAHDLHTAWANTAAVRAADLLHSMPPHPALIAELGLEDKIVLGPDNLPSGEFHEPEVYFLVSGKLAKLEGKEIDQQLIALETVCKRLARLGITCVHRMALAEPAEDIAFLLLLLELEQRGRLPIRVSTSFSAIGDHRMLEDVELARSARDGFAKARAGDMNAAELHDHLLKLIEDHHKDGIAQIAARTNKDQNRSKSLNAEIRAGFAKLHEHIHHKHIRPHTNRKNPHHDGALPKYLNPSPKIRCDTVKIFMDGVIEKETAYRMDKQPSDGIPEFSQEQLNALVELADKLGLQVAAHCIGDGSVKSMTAAIARTRHINAVVDAERGHSIPHRIEHIEMCRRQDMESFGRNRIVSSMQPLHERPPVTMWHKLVPKAEWDTAFAWRDAIENGSTLVFGSDWPIVSCDPLAGIRHAVSRKPWYEGAPREKLDLAQALAAYTTHPAQTEYSAEIRGRIEPGMLADIVVLNGRIEELGAPNRGESIQVDITICDGKTVSRNL